MSELPTELPTQTKIGGLAQLARALALQAKGHRFDSDILHRSLDVIHYGESSGSSPAHLLVRY